LSGLRAYKVVARVRESRLITSFHLAPADGSALVLFRPGQFLVFRLATADGEITRNFSLSGPPDPRGQYRISVKREDRGAGSCHLHDHVQMGDTLHANGPPARGVCDVPLRTARG
jgi:ferredoxin-NADP reductase